MTQASTSAGAVASIDPQSRLADDVHEMVREGIDLDSPNVERREDSFWRGLTELGTDLWLDTGEIEASRPLWNEQFVGMTTNNTLLNHEVQKGTYDDLIPQASKLLSRLGAEQQVREIAFILNTRHALRLVEEFGCRVSVELHTDVAHDHDATLAYARRCHEICPEFFIVKVPLTPSGLTATRSLRTERIPINLTLGFSARQNYVATALANPSYVNVFLGRLNAYVADNGLGDGRFVGEKATLASQREVKVFALGLPQSETRQIAASLRDAGQLPRLAGVDVITMPPAVARDARQDGNASWQLRLDEDYEVSLAPDVNAETVRLEKLWSVSADERKFVEQMILHSPESADDLMAAAKDYGVHDLFPKPSSAELQTIADDGKVAQHHRWRSKIMRGEMAVDSLMTLAGLAHFSASQAELDERIRAHLS